MLFFPLKGKTWDGETPDGDNADIHIDTFAYLLTGIACITVVV